VFAVIAGRRSYGAHQQTFIDDCREILNSSCIKSSSAH